MLPTLTRRMQRRPSLCALVLLAAWITVRSASAQPATLEQRLRGRIADHSGRVAIAVKNLTSEETVFISADEPMPTASLIKVAVMATAYRQAEAGVLDLNDKVTLREEDKVPGSGVLTKHFSAGIELTLRDAVRLMIACSDNTATNLVAGKVGLDAVCGEMERLGLPETKMHAFVYRGDTSIFPERSKRFGLGSTTAREMQTLLERIYRGELASPEGTAAMINHLKACEDRNQLPRLLPSGTVIAHKTGAVSAARTDAGIIESPSGPIVVVVLTADNEDRRWTADNAAEVLIGEIGRDVYDHFRRRHDSHDVAEPRVLSVGADGWLVEAVQRTLNARLDPSPELSIDGDFGPVTAGAVRTYQKSCGLSVTGDVDAATWAALGPLVTSEEVITDPEAFPLELPDRLPADALEGPPFVTCRGWVIGDAASGEVVGGGHFDESLENASTTKLMTAWLVLQTVRDDPSLLDQFALVTERAAETPGSTARVQAGERLTIRDLLYGLLLPSGNDAAVVFAEHFGDRFAPPEDDPDASDSLVRFVAEMNRTAATLGMTQTHFANPHGLSAPDHRTTPRDLLRLATRLVQQGDILPYVATRKHIGRIESASQYVRYQLWTNTNRLLDTEGYLGMKTGTTGPAGACLVSLSQRGDRRLIAVVLGSTSSDARYVDTRNLFRWAWREPAELTQKNSER